MRIHQLYIKECVSVVWATRDYYEVDTQGEPESDLDRVFKSVGCLFVAKRILDEIQSVLVQPHYYWYNIAVNPRRNSIGVDNTIWQWVSGDTLSPHCAWERQLIEYRSKSFNMPEGLAPPAEETLKAVHQSVKSVHLFDVMEQPLLALWLPSTATLAEGVSKAVRVIKKDPNAGEKG